eukprot:2171635-Pleurochrysis_carterae.AAC.1
MKLMTTAMAEAVAWGARAAVTVAVVAAVVAAAAAVAAVAAAAKLMPIAELTRAKTGQTAGKHRRVLPTRRKHLQIRKSLQLPHGRVACVEE